MLPKQNSFFAFSLSLALFCLPQLGLSQEQGSVLLTGGIRTGAYSTQTTPSFLGQELSYRGGDSENLLFSTLSVEHWAMDWVFYGLQAERRTFRSLSAQATQTARLQAQSLTLGTAYSYSFFRSDLSLGAFFKSGVAQFQTENLDYTDPSKTGHRSSTGSSIEQGLFFNALTASHWGYRLRKASCVSSVLLQTHAGRARTRVVVGSHSNPDRGKAA